MAMKVGLNRQEQLRCAKWLEEGIEPSLVAKKLKTSVEVVKRFTQKKLDAAAKKADARAKKMNLVAQNNQKKAAIVKAALAPSGDEDEDEDDQDFE